jgi:hypothetical protein
MIDNLTDDNFLIYAIKCYDNPNCVMSEFEDDLKRLKYIRRLVKRYKITGDLKERLILNHIIVLSNVFGTEAAVRMLFFKINTEDYYILKTFCLFLNIIPKNIYGINGKHIRTDEIPVDLNIARKLRTLTGV